MKRGTSTEWGSEAAPLMAGEIGYDSTLNVYKGGDGSTAFGSLPTFIADSGGKIDDGWIPATVARTESPTFTGTPAAPTAPSGTSTGQIATTEFVKTAVDYYLLEGDPA